MNETVEATANGKSAHMPTTTGAYLNVPIKSVVVQKEFDNVGASEDSRQHYDAKVERLSRSIAKNGLLNPVTVVELGDGTYGVRAGFKRLAALKLLKAKDVDVHVVSAEGDVLKNLAENTARSELNPYVMAEKLFVMVTDEKTAEKLGHGGPGPWGEYSRKEAADALGISEQHVGNMVRLYTKLSPEVLAAWKRNPSQFSIMMLLRWTMLEHKDQKKMLDEYVGADEKGAKELRKRGVVKGAKGAKFARTMRKRGEVEEALAGAKKGGGIALALEWVLGQRKKL